MPLAPVEGDLRVFDGVVGKLGDPGATSRAWQRRDSGSHTAAWNHMRRAAFYKSHRRNTPPSAPRTTALPRAPAVLLPVDLANSAAT
jgi:hypothetical protein